MPLDARKLAKIAVNTTRLRQARTQPVTLTFKHADGSTTTQSVNVIIRPMEDDDPALDPSRRMPQTISNNTANTAAVMSVLTGDVSFNQMRSCIYVDLPDGSPGTVIATRLIPGTIEPKGMAPGGDRLIIALARQR